MQPKVITEQFSQALMYLANINDKLRKIEDETFDTNSKLSRILRQLEKEDKPIEKHYVFVKQVNTKKKEDVKVEVEK